MAKVKKALDGRDSHIQTLRYVIIILCFVIVGLIWGWSKAPDNITLHTPPDLRTGSMRNINEIPPYNVYGFGLYIWQQINNWPISGEKDYPSNIEKLSCYITPRFKSMLQNDYEQKKRRSELRRARFLQEMIDRSYKTNRIKVESESSWVAFYDVSIKESYRGETIKDIFVRYPIRIVKWDVNPECNPWGLALDEYAADPSRIESRYARQND